MRDIDDSIRGRRGKFLHVNSAIEIHPSILQILGYIRMECRRIASAFESHSILIWALLLCPLTVVYSLMLRDSILPFARMAFGPFGLFWGTAVALLLLFELSGRFQGRFATPHMACAGFTGSVLSSTFVLDLVPQLVRMANAGDHNEGPAALEDDSPEGEVNALSFSPKVINELPGMVTVNQDPEELLLRIHPMDRPRIRHLLATGESVGQNCWVAFQIRCGGGILLDIAGNGQFLADKVLTAGRIGAALNENHFPADHVLEELVAFQIGEERRRISQDLHDDIGQQLTGASLMAKSLANTLQRAGAAQTEIAQELAAALPEIARAMRHYVHELMPADPGEECLLSSLRDLAAQTEKCTGIACRVEYDGTVEVKNRSACRHLSFIAQEAVNNAVKHSRATEILIKLREDRGEVVLQIKDNGIGLSQTGALRDGLGLRILRYRAELLGASLTMESERGDGTTVCCRWHSGGHDGL